MQDIQDIFHAIYRAQAEKAKIQKRFQRGKATNWELFDAYWNLAIAYYNASRTHGNKGWRTRYANLVVYWIMKADSLC